MSCARPAGSTWSGVSVDSFSLRAVKGDLTGANPTDRGNAGSKLHVAGEAGGLPLSVILSAAAPTLDHAGRGPGRHPTDPHAERAAASVTHDRT
jgi:hypothetical protein